MLSILSLGPRKNSTLLAASTAHAQHIITWSKEKLYTLSCIYCSCSAYYHLVQGKTLHSQLYLLRMVSISLGPGKNSTLPAVSNAHAHWSREKLYTTSCIYCACSLVQGKTLHPQLYLLRMLSILLGPGENSTLPAVSNAHDQHITWSREKLYPPSCIYCACSAYFLVQGKTLPSQLYLMRMLSISPGPGKNSTLPAVSTAHAQHITWSREKLYTSSCI
jgi:hypothetical protein